MSFSPFDTSRFGESSCNSVCRETFSHFESPPRLNAYSRWISQRSQRLGVKKQVVALMVFLDFGSGFLLLYDSWWVLVIFEEKEEKSNCIKKINMGLEFGLDTFLKVLSLSKKNPTKMFYFHFISLFCLSFRLTPEVCFILMGLSQKAFTIRIYF